MMNFPVISRVFGIIKEARQKRDFLANRAMRAGCLHNRESLQVSPAGRRAGEV